MLHIYSLKTTLFSLTANAEKSVFKNMYFAYIHASKNQPKKWKTTTKNWVSSLVQMLAFSYSYFLMISIPLAMLTLPVNVQAQGRENHMPVIFSIMDLDRIFVLPCGCNTMPLGPCFIYLQAINIPLLPFENLSSYSLVIYNTQILIHAVTTYPIS